MTPPPQHPRKQAATLAAGLVFCIALYFVLFGGAGSLDRQGLHTRLDEVSAFAANHAAQFTYGEMEEQGWGYDRQFIIHKPQLAYAGWVVSAERMAVMPDRVSADKIRVSINDAVTITRDKKIRYVVEFREPLQYEFTQGKAGATGHAAQLPDAITLRADRQENIAIRLASNALLMSANWEKAEYNLRYTAGGVQVAQGEAALFSAESLSMDILQRQDEGQPQKRYKMNLGNLRMQEASLDSYNAAIDIETAPAAGQAGYERVAYINKLDLTGDNFRMVTGGELYSAAGDELPFGKLLVSVNNAPALLGSAIARKLLGGNAGVAFEQITGLRPQKAPEELDLPIAREKNGETMIGAASLKEVVATLGAPAVHSTTQSTTPNTQGEQP